MPWLEELAIEADFLELALSMDRPHSMHQLKSKNPACKVELASRAKFYEFESKFLEKMGTLAGQKFSEVREQALFLQTYFPQPKARLSNQEGLQCAAEKDTCHALNSGLATQIDTSLYARYRWESHIKSCIKDNETSCYGWH